MDPMPDPLLASRPELPAQLTWWWLIRPSGFDPVVANVSSRTDPNLFRTGATYGRLHLGTACSSAGCVLGVSSAFVVSCFISSSKTLRTYECGIFLTV